jgi:hypothetical protein
LEQFQELSLLVKEEKVMRSAWVADDIGKSRTALLEVIRGNALEPVELCIAYVNQCTKYFSQKLGSGAFGEVYLGNDEQANVQFAVKKVPFDVSSDEIEKIVLTLQQEMAVSMHSYE